MTRILALFKPPRFENEEKTRQAFLLSVILWTLVVVPILLFLYALLFYREIPTRVLAQVLSGLGVNAFLLILVQRGHIRSASILQVAALWIFFTVNAWTDAGVYHQAYQIGYAVVISIAGFLLGMRGALITVVVSLLSGGLMVVASDMGLWPFKSPDKGLTVWVVSAILFPVLAVLQYLGGRVVRMALSQSRTNQNLLNESQKISKIGGWEYDVSTHRVAWTDEAYRIHGVTKDYDPSEPAQDIKFYLHEHQTLINEAFRRTIEHGEPYDLELQLITAQGIKLWVRTMGQAEYTGGRITRVFGNIMDITERKQAEEERLRNQEATDRLAREMDVIAKIGRFVGSTLDINQVYERVATETLKLIPYDRLLVNLKTRSDGQIIVAYVSGIDIPGRRLGDLYPSQGSATGAVMSARAGILIQPDDAEELKDIYPHLYESFKTGIRSLMGVPLISMDEVIGCMNFRSQKWKAYNENDLRLAERIGAQVAGAIANAQLFTDLKKTEKLLRENNDLFSLFMRHSPVYTYIKEVTPTQSLVLQASDNYQQMIGISADEMVGKSMTELFPPEFGAKITADDWAVVSSGDILTLDEELNDRTYNTIKFPIVQGDKKLLAGYTVDITERKRTEKQLQDTLESLRKAVGVTVQVMVSAVETRDPYTSGHQLRSANLARTIAMEMGLPQDKIDAIRMAGSIHDIGKLSIPAEILSKPTKLSDIEFGLIKEHARQGYELLKDVESPWPLAEIVRQHHERLDGSGYPRNLKGDDILIEARILAVADVVESIASHRPYRPALGIDVAMEEIDKNRGTLYDDAVAGACLRLFREKGFKLVGSPL